MSSSEGATRMRLAGGGVSEDEEEDRDGKESEPKKSERSREE